MRTKCIYSLEIRFLLIYFGGVTMTEREILNDIEFLIGSWFSALEDEGCDPWEDEVCMSMANKYEYTREDYQKYCSKIY